jgi:F420-non-reducing hydrogenase iron-sulfur subunit
MTQSSALHSPDVRPADEGRPFEPKIVGFLCNWCSYAGADLAGVSRFQYPPNLRVIRVMCSGRVDPSLVVRAFSRGSDGVMILGCHPGDCHYATGNYYARNRAQVLSQLFEAVGLNTDRFLLDWVSAGEGERFATLVGTFTERVRALGPLGTETGPGGKKLSAKELQERLTAASHVVQGERVRWLVGRKNELLGKGDVYGRPISVETFDALLESSVADEYLRNRLLLLTTNHPLSVKELASEIGMAPKKVLPHVMALEQAGLMTMAGIEGYSPRYQGVQQMHDAQATDGRTRHEESL